MKKDIYIWGAGQYGVLTAFDLEKKGIKINAFIDTNASQIKTRLGLPVLFPEQVLSVTNPYIVVAVVNNKEIIKQLDDSGLTKGENFKISNLIATENENPSKFYFNQKGFCPICEQETTFFAENSWLRDYFICLNCNSIPRQRALMLILQKNYPNWRELKIHESSPSKCAISEKFKTQSKEYVASQYFFGKKLGTIIDGFRNENLEEQTFENETFDIVITQDVFEHVYNPQKAFSEIARTLRGGGGHIFTVPLINKLNKTEIWAKCGDNNEPIFLQTEEWHGNPIDKMGSPVTMHWGYDVVDFIKKYSGLNTKIEYINNLKYGIRAEYIEVLVSKKE